MPMQPVIRSGVLSRVSCRFLGRSWFAGFGCGGFRLPDQGVGLCDGCDRSAVVIIVLGILVPPLACSSVRVCPALCFVLLIGVSYVIHRCFVVFTFHLSVPCLI